MPVWRGRATAGHADMHGPFVGAAQWLCLTLTCEGVSRSTPGAGFALPEAGKTHAPWLKNKRYASELGRGSCSPKAACSGLPKMVYANLSKPLY
jgi:hypothetical protein